MTFGFQLYNVIPGYHKPAMDTMEPSYELIHTQMKTQEWDSTKVIHPTNVSFCLPTSLNTHTNFDSNFRLYLRYLDLLVCRIPKEFTAINPDARANKRGLCSDSSSQGKGVKLKSPCNRTAIREIHSKFPAAAAIDFSSVFHTL